MGFNKLSNNFTGICTFFGRFGNFWGHERLYITGLVGFIFASLICSLAPSILLLIIFRAIQWFAAAMMLSVSLGIIKTSFPVSMLGKSLGIYAVVIASAIALAPAIGGILEGLLGWRSIFLVNIPAGILNFIICYKILERRESTKIKWDIVGTIFQFFTLFSLVYLLNYLSSNPINMEAILLGGFSISMLSLFIWWENRTDPILNLSLLKMLVFLHTTSVCI